ncbi:stellacyanin-like [Pyrus ussuriensis x Pyrus communis]|uniref:Stellacyanin-like n=1 Tax=Pyrus ussuriensis x Pyrus communis TaxID=2448454 RepID=A0A5N5HXZ3_9ROSA|nr:stellacyanin-like [Pyrus ussuriensis x Pyrus communis]
MASNKFLTLVTLVVILLPTIAMATDFVVGGDSGWTTGVDYPNWAKDKTFHVGDALVFKYSNPPHNVFKVNGTGFKECVKPTANDQAPLTSGNDRIELKTPGNKWYICTAANHCDLGQKLVITVMDAAPASAPSSSVRRIIFSGYQVFAAAVVGVLLAVAV